jgi:Phosphatidylinositol-glycan biosynthesis class S protein
MPSSGEADSDSDGEQVPTPSQELKSGIAAPELAAPAKKQPPPETAEAIWLRSKIILSFWAVIVFLGLPVWWQTTSIYRARLPIQEMLDSGEGRVCVFRSQDMILADSLVGR